MWEHQTGRSSRCVGDKFHEQLLPKAIEATFSWVNKSRTEGERKKKVSITSGTID